MLEIRAVSIADNPGRILKYNIALSSLRPRRIAPFFMEILDLSRLSLSVNLYNRFGDGDVKRFSLNWDDNLREFLCMIEKCDLIPINWIILDDFYDIWQQESDYEYCDGGEVIESTGKNYMAAYLTGIPLKTYGWSDEALLNESQDHWRVILASFIGIAALDECTISKLDLHEYLDYPPDEIKARLQNDDFSKYDHPLDLLPDICYLIAGETGNEIIDTYIDFGDLDPWRWRWDRDLERLNREWIEAKPLVEKYDKFDKWFFAGDYEEKIIMMLRTLCGIGHIGHG